MQNKLSIYFESSESLFNFVCTFLGVLASLTKKGNEVHFERTKRAKNVTT
jgi:hypothetical protein